ncbi:hypothetical protein BK004_01645 [bacterium CG10_46_32]|nr:MAG: hypothetical protein BK004_01645 [bacterium CG10_46_32]
MKNHAIIVLFLIPASAIFGSLFYEFYAKFQPCFLCWWQRIFMYPQAILAGAALAYQTRDIIKYLIPFSILGALTSALHYANQIHTRLNPLADPLVACAPGAASCSGVYVFYYGYITIPLMTLTAFLLLLIVALIAREKRTSGDSVRQLLG